MYEARHTGGGRKRHWAAAAIMAMAAWMPAVTGDALPERTRTVPQETEPVFYPFTPVQLALRPGERLEYEARWMGFPAGTLVLECRWPANKGDHEAYYVRAKIVLNNLTNPFYKVDNEAISIINKEDGSSDQFTLRRNEGAVRQRENVVYDYAKMLAVYTRRSPNKPDEKHEVSVQLLDKVVDPFSFLYYLRGTELRPQKDVYMLVNTSQRNWNMRVRTLKRMKLTVPRGEFNALKIEPVASFPGLIERRGRMYLYVEETTHVPLLIQTDIPIGSITFSLSGSANSPLDEAGDGDVEGTPAGKAAAGKTAAAERDEGEKGVAEEEGGGKR
ncbi:MAG: DUF3108 domain-containing protein [Planctomycetes bacterium]|nr:DUF3108 domain-containing protein [Planctomycetota bacterium]